MWKSLKMHKWNWKLKFKNRRNFFAICFVLIVVFDESDWSIYRDLLQINLAWISLWKMSITDAFFLGYTHNSLKKIFTSSQCWFCLKTFQILDVKMAQTFVVGFYKESKLRKQNNVKFSVLRKLYSAKPETQLSW